MIIIVWRIRLMILMMIPVTIIVHSSSEVSSPWRSKSTSTSNMMMMWRTWRMVGRRWYVCRRRNIHGWWYVGGRGGHDARVRRSLMWTSIVVSSRWMILASVVI